MSYIVKRYFKAENKPFIIETFEFNDKDSVRKYLQTKSYLNIHSQFLRDDFHGLEYILVQNHMISEFL